MDETFSHRFSDALVSEIKAEMGRRGFSSRALGARIGESSQYMSMRLDGGNPRTGERVVLNVRDLFAIARALDIDPGELVRRAQELADRPDNIVTGRFGVGSRTQDLDAVARPTDPDTGEEE